MTQAPPSAKSRVVDRGSLLGSNFSHRLRILAVMWQEIPGMLPEAWRCYGNIDEARKGALIAVREIRAFCAWRLSMITMARCGWWNG